MSRHEKQISKQIQDELEKNIGKSIKKPLCAYAIYVKDVRLQAQQSNPHLHHVQIMKLVGK